MSSAMLSFVRSLELSIRDCKVDYTYFQIKIAEVTLKVDQGHW